MKLTLTFAPSFNDLKKDVDEFKRANNGIGNDEMAHKFGDWICLEYAAFGAASALPGAIPGFGTVAQIAIEGGAIATDLALMLRWMASMTFGIALIFGRDIESEFNQNFIKVLGMWCGVLTPAKEAAARLGTKIALAQFKNISGDIFKKINQKIGTTIVTKYGSKRGGIALGKLIPLGVGALIGGGFNFVTMKGYKNAAICFYSSNNDTELVMNE